MGSRSWKDSRKSGVRSGAALVTRLLAELEEHGLCVVQLEGFPGNSRRADWEEQQEAWELITRGQTYRGDPAPVEGILQTVLNCVRPTRGWRPQSRVHWVCQAQVRALWSFVTALDTEKLVLLGVPAFRAPGLVLCILRTQKQFWYSQIVPLGLGNGGPG